MEHVQYAFFCIRMISLIIVILRFIHVVVISGSFHPSFSEHFLFSGPTECPKVAFHFLSPALELDQSLMSPSSFQQRMVSSSREYLQSHMPFTQIPPMLTFYHICLILCVCTCTTEPFESKFQTWCPINPKHFNVYILRTRTSSCITQCNDQSQENSTNAIALSNL